jgi:hypothetical protein
MSVHLLDRAVAALIPKSVTGGWADTWMLLEEGGDNNCYVTATGARARNWSCIAVGEQSDALAAVCTRSAACCGGMLRLAKSAHTEPEGYIKWWRTAMKTPVALADLGQLGIRAELMIEVDCSDAADMRYNIENCMTKLVREPEIVTLYGVTRMRWNIDAGNQADMSVWAESYTKHPWQKCRVS